MSDSWPRWSNGRREHAIAEAPRRAERIYVPRFINTR